MPERTANSSALSDTRQARVTYIALAVGTIALGLWLQRGAVFSRNARDVLGDALWASMMMWWVSAAIPRARLGARCAVAVGICLAVELSQLVHAPAIDAVRQTTFGHLLLGTDFDARDLAAYTIGVLGAAVLEWVALGRRLQRRVAE